ncbi:MAG: aminotransferase class IV [Micrococcales bacterium]|nr:aminotransferase class IV [Micrococcales bacterium]
MSAPTAPPWEGIAVWRGGELVVREDEDLTPARMLAADSWLVVDGAVRALELHRRRFRDAVTAAATESAWADTAGFWDAAMATTPRTGSWFPRVEARWVRGAIQLQVRMRRAPTIRRSIVLVTAETDPRRHPRTKGPDLEAMLRLRTLAQARHADEEVILDAEGAIAEGSTTCLMWWRPGPEGRDVLGLPADDIPRIDSVTVRSVLALATAMGIEVRGERARPDQLEGCEIWALSALHGARIVTRWVDGPLTAEQPGRLGSWRARLDALRRPIAPLRPGSVERVPAP